MSRHKLTKADSKKGGETSVRTVSLKKALRESFLKEIETDGNMTPEKFVNKCIQNGMEGNSGMAKMIFEYVDGKVKDEIEVKTLDISTPLTDAINKKRKTK